MAAPTGIIGSVIAGTSIANAFLVAVQKIAFDVKGEDDVAFVFAYRGEDAVELTSDITDHYVEDNTAIQDQISLKPETITLQGFIGELTDQSNGLASKVNEIVNQLTVLAPYQPALVAAALDTYNQAQAVYNSIASSATTLVQAYDMLVGNDLQTKQQKAFGYFYQKWKDRELFTVQTPWNMFEDMAIVSLKTVQSEETNTVSDFSVTFKKIRFAETLLQTTTVVQGRLTAQSAKTVNQGFQSPPSTFALGPADSFNLGRTS